MAPRTLGLLGISKVMTVTSTYDHRIIQGAESGLFLARIEELLKGEDGFYERIFEDLGPAPPAGQVGDGRASRALRAVRRPRGDGEAGAGAPAHPRLPRARAPRLRPRPARLQAHAPPRPRSRHLRPDPVGPGPRVHHERPLREGQGHAARDPGGPARDLLRDDRRRVHVHRRPRAEGLAPEPHGVDPQLPRPRPGEPEARPREGRGGGELRALPAREVRRPQALLPGGRRDPDPAARPHPERRRPAGRGRGRDGHAPPRPAERPREHGGQAARPDLLGVRGQRGPRFHPGLGRREVPPRGHGHPPRGDGRDAHRHPRPQPEPPGVRGPGGGGDGAGPAGRARRPPTARA